MLQNAAANMHITYCIYIHQHDNRTYRIHKVESVARHRKGKVSLPNVNYRKYVKLDV